MANNKKVSRPWTAHRIHQWCGLIAGIWVLVLGGTGFFLDHRDWRWLWQTGLDEKWISDAVVKKSQEGRFRLYHIDARNQHHILAGSTGLWWSQDGGHSWLATQFINDTPQIKAIVDDRKTNGAIKWLATDNGIWQLTDNARIANYWALEDRFINALTQGSHDNELLGVVDRTHVFKINIATKEIDWLPLGVLEPQHLPEKIDLSRFVRDVHFGRGVFNAPWSMLWSDATAITMVVLPITGLLYWWLPRRWKRLRHDGHPVKKKYKQNSIRYLFRTHAPIAGVITFIPLLYLSITGIFLDHAEGLRDFMKSVNITRSWQTPVYNYTSWDGEIYGIAAYPEQSDKFSLGTRLGLFTSEDGGQTWQRERLMPATLANKKSAFIWMLKRYDDMLFIGGMGAPNFVKQNAEPWKIVKGAGHMPSDVTLDKQGNWWWMTRHGIKKGVPGSGFEHYHVHFPEQQQVPWYFILDGLHSGVLIHTQWKWINDIVAVLTLFLVITGLIRWWRVKWL